MRSPGSIGAGATVQFGYPRGVRWAPFASELQARSRANLSGDFTMMVLRCRLPAVAASRQNLGAGRCDLPRSRPCEFIDFIRVTMIPHPCPTSCVWVYRPAERPCWQIVAASCPIGWDFVTPTPPSNLKANLAISPRPIPLMGRKDWTTLRGGGLSGSPPLTKA
jgi:hypothetical protein